MSNDQYTKKFASGLLTVVIGVIILSFAFSGFQGSFNFANNNTVAMVEGEAITIREFQSMLQRQMQFYSQMMGGKPLTAAQVKQFRLKETVLNQLVRQKMTIALAGEVDLGAGEEEVKTSIRELPYFQNEGQFDVGLYRRLLQANGMSPSDFEDITREDVKAQKVRDSLGNIKVSKNFSNAVADFKARYAETNLVQVIKDNLVKYIDVSDKEISDYLASEANKAEIEKAYNFSFDRYNKKARINASHILLTTQGKDEKEVLKKAKAIRKKLNKRNFAKMANKNTEDPSGKATGGALGWFEKGRMVPEFERTAFAMNKGQISQPIKTQFGYHIIYVTDKEKAYTTPLDQVRPELAKELIQKTKTKELDELYAKVTKEIEDSMKNGDEANLRAMSVQYGFTFTPKDKINRYFLRSGDIVLDSKHSGAIFDEAKLGQVQAFREEKSFLAVKVSKFGNEIKNDKDRQERQKQEMDSLNQSLSKQLDQDVMNTLTGNYTVYTYPERM